MGLTRTALLALVLAALVVPARALAYRTAAAEFGFSTPMSRPSPVVQFAVYGAGSAGPSEDAILAALEQAAAAWTSPCVPIEPMILGSAASEPSSFDGLSSIVVITSGWEARGYPTNQAAVAEMRYLEVPGSLQIADADLYLNADTIDWTATDAPELRAVFSHELGHILVGLVHPCSLDGLRAPLCTDIDRAGSIMHPEYLAGAWTPHEDDLAGACALVIEVPCETVECASTEYCVDGECVAADMCSDGTTCAGGVCALAGPGAGMCTIEGGLGARCMSGADCSTRLCLTVPREERRYCTRACGVDAECADGEACRMVDGAQVCGPPPPSACSAHPARRSLLPLALFALVLVIRGYRRTS